jgi:hypothetical protein
MISVRMMQPDAAPHFTVVVSITVVPTGIAVTAPFQSIAVPTALCSLAKVGASAANAAGCMQSASNRLAAIADFMLMNAPYCPSRQIAARAE